MSKLHRDFTQGSIGGHLIRFSLPFMLSNFIQALYSVTDMLIVGRFASTASLSGVSNGAQVTNIIVMMISGLTVGGTVLVAQYFGARKEKDVSETIGTMLSIMALAGMVLTAIMMAISGWVLTAMQVPAEAFSEAQTYTNICLLGTLFIFGYNAISSIQRGLGDANRPLVFVTIACTINVGLDLLLVAQFRMGAAGAAWATILSQGISMLLSAAYLRRNGFVFDFRMKSFKIHRDKLRLLVNLGLPSSVQSTVVNLSFLIMTGIVNGFGVDASAAVGIAGRFNSFAILPAIAMSAAVSSMAAQNIGAEMYDRAKKTLVYGVGIALMMGAAVFAIAQLFSEPIIMLFLNEQDPEVIAYGVRYMRGFSFDYLVVPFVFCFNGLINGAGYTNFTLMNSLLSSIVLRVPMASWLSKTDLGLLGVGLAAPIASLLSTIVALAFLISGRWMKNPTGIRREMPAEQ